MDIFNRRYTPININLKKFTDKEYEFYYKILIGDEFVEYLFIWEMYSELLDTMLKSSKVKSNKGKPYIFDIMQIEKWCLDNKLIYEGLKQVTLKRDEIIEDLISLNLNPYWNGLDLEPGNYNILKMFRENLDECVDEIKKIKKCILDGYRFNLLIWDDTMKKYILHHRNIPVYIRSNVLSRMGDDAIQTNANYIISSNIAIKQSQQNRDIYQFEHAGCISIMDAYVNVDLDFLKH